MKKYMDRLLNVRSVVTLAMTAALIGMLFSGVQPPGELLTLYCTSYGAVIAHFFTKKEDEL